MLTVVSARPRLHFPVIVRFFNSNDFIERISRSYEEEASPNDAVPGILAAPAFLAGFMNGAAICCEPVASHAESQQFAKEIHTSASERNGTKNLAHYDSDGDVATSKPYYIE
ncbi:hypothetical protein Y032_0003g1164 [Ancylostoma ceylanicum]|nr:hypothetical protein Y032_0003g1164 [Ancylostoma ceylanicum]